MVILDQVILRPLLNRPARHHGVVTARLHDHRNVGRLRLHTHKRLQFLAVQEESGRGTRSVPPSPSRLRPAASRSATVTAKDRSRRSAKLLDEPRLDRVVLDQQHSDGVAGHASSFLFVSRAPGRAARPVRHTRDHPPGQRSGQARQRCSSYTPSPLGAGKGAYGPSSRAPGRCPRRPWPRKCQPIP